MKKRIWELDTFRGACLLIMVAIHVTFDLTELTGLCRLRFTGLYDFGREWTGVLFLLLSGVCVTLGAHPVKRGLTVLGCGMLVTAVTMGMAWLNMADDSILIWFGVLHCLGICMLLWVPARRLPTGLLPVLGAAVIAVGFWLLECVHTQTPLLVPLGITPRGFASSDYFPLFPYFGFFLLGAYLGRRLYRERRSLFPRPAGVPVRVLEFLGRHSLAVYLIHQPLIYALIRAISFLFGRQIL